MNLENSCKFVTL